jgi:hypothetical protein
MRQRNKSHFNEEQIKEKKSAASLKIDKTD